MDILTTLLQLLLAVFGVDLGGSRHVHHDRVDGVDMLHSIATVESGVARFECLASASGECVYTVLPGTCAAIAGTRLGRCAPAQPRRFALTVGDRRAFPGMSVDRVCVDRTSTGAAAECGAPAPVARP